MNTTRPIQCERCGKRGRLPIDFVGKIHCPGCRHVIELVRSTFVPSGRKRPGFAMRHPIATALLATGALVIAGIGFYLFQGPVAVPPSPAGEAQPTAADTAPFIAEAGRIKELFRQGDADAKSGRHEAAILEFSEAIEAMRRLGFADGDSDRKEAIARVHFELAAEQFFVKDTRGLQTLRDGIRILEGSSPGWIELGS